MTWPLTAITVPVKPCCGLLVGEVCDCAEFAASWLVALETPIYLPPHADVPCLTDPALTGCECCYADGHTRRCGRPATTESNVAPFGVLPLAEECRARIFGDAS